MKQYNKTCICHILFDNWNAIKNTTGLRLKSFILYKLEHFIIKNLDLVEYCLRLCYLSESLIIYINIYKNYLLQFRQGKVSVKATKKKKKKKVPNHNQETKRF